MPKKPSTLLVMTEFRPLSSRRWYRIAVVDVRRTKKAEIRFDLSVIGEPDQAGRLIVHDLPAVLAPNSPLSKFLASGFGIRLSENQSLELTTLVGRELEVRFIRSSDGEQAIALVRNAAEVGDSHAPPLEVIDHKEVRRGLE